MRLITEESEILRMTKKRYPMMAAVQRKSCKQPDWNRRAESSISSLKKRRREGRDSGDFLNEGTNARSQQDSVM